MAFHVPFVSVRKNFNKVLAAAFSKSVAIYGQVLPIENLESLSKPAAFILRIFVPCFLPVASSERGLEGSQHQLYRRSSTHLKIHDS
jgi:hypothetical protein